MFKGQEGYTLLQPKTDSKEQGHPQGSPTLENHEIFRHNLQHREEEYIDELFNKNGVDNTRILFFPRGPLVMHSLVLLLLIILNVTVVVIHYANPNLLLLDVKLAYWLVLVDSVIGSFQFLWFTSKLFMYILTSLYHKHFYLYHIAHLATNYESSVRWILWAIFLAVIYPIRIRPYFSTNSDVDNVVWAVFKSMLAIASLYAFKMILVNVIEIHVYKDIHKALNESIWSEHLLMKLENVEDSEFSTNKLAFQSPSLRDLKGKLASNKTPEEAYHAISQEVINLYDRNQNGYLDMNDLLSLRHLTHQQATDIMKCFDKDQNDKISVEDMAKSLEILYQERKSIVNERKSRRLIVDVSNTLLNIILGFCCFFIILHYFGVDLSAFLIAIGTTVLALSFAYAKTIQEVFDSLYLLFVVRPFYVGDYIRVDDGPILIVDKVGLLSTYFTSWDGYGVYIRNSIISNSKLSNLNKGYVFEEIHVRVSNLATPQDLGLLSEQIAEYLENSPMWSSKFQLFAYKVDTREKAIEMKLQVKLKKDIKWQDLSKWQAAKSNLVLKIDQTITSLGLKLQPRVQHILMDNK